MPRHRSVRLAVLGTAVQRATTERYSSRTNPALRRRIVLGLLVLASLVLVTLYFREPQSGSLHDARSAGAAVLKPFQVAADRVVQPFRDGWDYLSGLISAKDDVARLQVENRVLR